MRKLRLDITLKEAWEWAMKGPDGDVDDDQWVYDSLYEIVTRQSRDDYPDSFYDPAIPGCFGRFWNPNSHEIWGHLHDVDIKTDIPYLCENGVWYQTFESGLPQDVDENGWPKEEA